MTVTRNDVARAAGVSPAVVSYVINHGPRPVAAETRKRVEATIAALGYQPDVVAGALRGGKSRTIGMLMPSPTNPFFAEMATRIEEALFDRDHVVTMGLVNDDARRTSVQSQSLRSRRADGLILLDGNTAGLVAESGWPRSRFIVVDQLVAADVWTSVHTDNRDAGRNAVRYLQELGHRVIACIAGPRGSASSTARVEGWREQLQLGGVEPGEDLLEHVDWSESGGASAAEALVGDDSRPLALRRVRPTALIVCSDIQAFGVLAACQRLGIRVPDELSIVSIDGTRLASSTAPGLTSIRHPYEELADEVVGLLLNRIADAREASEERTLRGNLVIGGTTAPLGG